MPNDPPPVDQAIATAMENAVDNLSDASAMTTPESSEGFADNIDPMDETVDASDDSIAGSISPASELLSANKVNNAQPSGQSPSATPNGLGGLSDGLLSDNESDPASPVERSPNTVSPELQTALVAVEDAISDVLSHDVQTDPTGIRRRLATLFAAVAKVGESASEDNQAELKSLVDRLIEEGLSKDLTPASANWLKFSKRPNDGMFAAGRIRRNRDTWLFDWNSTTPLTLRFAPGVEPETDTNVLIIGRLINGEPTATVEVSHIKVIDPS